MLARLEGRALFLTIASIGLWACAADATTEALATNGAVYSVTVGGEISLRLQSIGPGEYESPPLLSSASLRFVDASVVGPHVPAGVTQRFRFRGAAPGTTVITFRQSKAGAQIVDTVMVR